MLTHGELAMPMALLAGSNVCDPTEQVLHIAANSNACGQNYELCILQSYAGLEDLLRCHRQSHMLLRFAHPWGVNRGTDERAFQQLRNWTLAQVQNPKT